MNKFRLVAIVPMRHSSERVPGKNYRNFADKPLFHHVINALLDCSSIDKVVIDTDSPVVTKQAQEMFPNVLVLERPEHLRDGSIPMNDVLMNTIEQVPSDYYLQTHSTNPLLTSATISRGVNHFFKFYPTYDSLFSVTRKNVRYWDVLARPLNHNPNILLRTQDLPPIFEENSCMYIFNKEILQRKHNRIGDRPYLLEMPELEAQDIDVELNFLVAEFLFKQVNGLQS